MVFSGGVWTVRDFRVGDRSGIGAGGAVVLVAVVAVALGVVFAKLVLTRGDLGVWLVSGIHAGGSFSPFSVFGGRFRFGAGWDH